MKYRGLARLSREMGVEPERLIEAFEIENRFHRTILAEHDQKKRKLLYQEVYHRVHPIYAEKAVHEREVNPKFYLAKLFRKELEGGAILDVGCGEGHLLKSIAQQLKHKRLVGIDISGQVLPDSTKNIEYFCRDIIHFDIGYSFDVVFSDNVMEHIAPLDVPSHLSSIRNALRDEGTFIIIMPNRLFGPHDITKIVDYTHTNRIQAMGTHLYESTYGEMIWLLKKYSFKKFKMVLPVPRVQNYLPNLRLPASIMLYLENNRLLVRALYRNQFLARSLSRFKIILICN